MKLTSFIDIVYIIGGKFQKHVSQLCGFPLLSSHSISTGLLAVCFLKLYPKSAFPARQPTICCFETVMAQLLGNSSD
jgi:hypothetical protein